MTQRDADAIGESAPCEDRLCEAYEEAEGITLVLTAAIVAV